MKYQNVLNVISFLRLNSFQGIRWWVVGNSQGLFCGSYSNCSPLLYEERRPSRFSGRDGTGTLQNDVVALSLASGPHCPFNNFSLPYPLTGIGMDNLLIYLFSSTVSLILSLCNFVNPNTCIKYNFVLLFCLYYTFFSCLGDSD